MSSKKIIRFIHWAPRILCLLAILFISIFALDAFEPDLTIWQQIIGFLIHLIPSFILLIICVIAWKNELFGGILFAIIGIALSPFIYNKNYDMNHSVSMSLGIIATITLPFIIVGVLFIISHFLKKKIKNNN